MKKFSKLFLSCAAVAAVTAAVATSAMAASDITATYTAAGKNDATATLTIDASGYTAAQKTLLVLKPGVTLETVKVSEGDVIQIDQKDGNDTITVALPKDLADGVYSVYMGGDGSTHDTTFTVGKVSTRILGDVDRNGVITSNDSGSVAKHIVKLDTLSGDDLLAADTDDNGVISSNDVGEIAKLIVHFDTKKIDGKMTIAEKEYQTVSAR